MSLFNFRRTASDSDHSATAASANHHGGREPPFRAELFTRAQLEVHARALAKRHRVNFKKQSDGLLDRLAENEIFLRKIYGYLTRSLTTDQRHTPAEEWFIDNYYLMEEEIRTARRHLPLRYSRELPHLVGGLAAGQPRIHSLADELVVHLDGRLDADSITLFIAAYQEAALLKLGELWAMPIMLRLALIEYVRRVAAQIICSREERDLANVWATDLLTAARHKPATLILVLGDLARSNPPLTSAFVSEMSRLLQGKHHALALPLAWLEQRLAEHTLTLEGLLQAETHTQAADQISMGNCVAGLRVLGAIDWRSFVENLSEVDKTLRRDPAGIYPAMDFATRDRYRHVVEDLATRSRQWEDEVARRAVDLAAANVQPGSPAKREAHVGYYLIDDGLAVIEQALGARLPFNRRFGRWILHSPMAFYLGSVLLLTAGCAWGFALSGETETLPLWAEAVGLAALTLCASQLAIALVNWMATLLVPVRSLPRLDFSRGIPAEFRTMVVIPTMLDSERGIAALLEDLEIRFVGNQDRQISFALLTDFCDAPHETMPGDAELVSLARQGIERLNARYAALQPQAFFLAHRPRRWNELEGRWMGYERKRGKLEEFNRLLQKGEITPFSVLVGDLAVCASVRFVITMDTDTELPRDAARHLVETMAHPLVRPVIDPQTRRVLHGYGILQPRVAISLPSANRSLFARFFAGDPGIDPYTRLVSDVYQDLFGEGSFIGKGIYDVAAFGQVLGNRFPEERILSHDLLEGCHVRTGLVSDVQFYEDHPASFTVDTARRHRWIRGDWQIASWLLPRVPGPDACRTENALSTLSRWKIFDNLRRSLLPSAILMLLLVVWTTALSPLRGTLTVMAILFLPALVAALVEVLHKPEEQTPARQFRAVGRHLLRQVGYLAFTLSFLPYDVGVTLDAIGRTLWRLLVSHRYLLEWQTASDSQKKARYDLGGFFRAMAFAPTLAILIALLLSLQHPDALPVALPILALWLVSPLVAWWISRPREDRPIRLEKDLQLSLGRLARRTWAFFDDLIDEQNNFLPPDNLQERPIASVAHRTSPTNLGLALGAMLCAHDFGYISVRGLIERLGKTMGSMEKLERYEGHFYNWYDTRSLAVLPTPYVSTVDSGNLTALLLTVRQGLFEIGGDPILPPRAIVGLKDALLVLVEEIERLEKSSGPSPRNLRRASQQAIEFLADLDRPTPTLKDSLALLNRLGDGVASIEQLLGEVNEPELRWSLNLLKTQAQESRDSLRELTPWATLLFQRPSSLRHPVSTESGAEWEAVLQSLEKIPSLRALAALGGDLLPQIAQVLAADDDSGMTDDNKWLVEFFGELKLGVDCATRQLAALHALAGQCERLAQADFRFLFDEVRQQMSIGFNVAEKRCDPGFYDLLASEARLASFVAIAQRQLPQEHWFALGRRLTTAQGEPVLLSWSGSMFEYLMPSLLMPSYPDTLLDCTGRAAVKRQIQYGRQQDVPWGISESGYNATDAQLNYLYRSFGVPGLGFKRGLADDLVVAPYASLLALMVDPVAAGQNIEQLARAGMEGRYGLYEAIDFTPRRVPSGEKGVIIRSFMAHHQGMGLLALGNMLLDAPMPRRFLADPRFRATELLLQERIPDTAPIAVPPGAEPFSQPRSAAAEARARIYPTSNTVVPEVQLLSNGRYHVMVSAAGSGYSRWEDLAVTRWREDPTRDCWGSYCYIRDLAAKSFWSATHQPTLVRADSYEANFQQARAEFRRRDLDIVTHTEISVSSEDDVEWRRITLTNHSRARRLIELTSYAEVVLTTPASDRAHPVFSNLFVETEIIRHRRAIVCTRRPRSDADHPPWMFHLMTVENSQLGEASFETDRAKFIGRGRSLESPAAMFERRLSDSAGAVLDPVTAIRQTFILQPEQVLVIGLVTGVAKTRAEALALIDKHQDNRLAMRVFEMAFTHSQLMRRQLNASAADAELFGQLLGSIIYSHRRNRAEPGILAKNRRTQAALWSYGISGDLPIVLVRIVDPANLDLVRKVLQAHAYWRLQGVKVDLVICNEDHSGYRQELHDQIIGLIQAGPETHALDQPGGIFVRRAELMPPEDYILLQAVARVVLADSAGTFLEQVDKSPAPLVEAPRLAPTRRRIAEAGLSRPPTPNSAPSLLFYNGFGGFTPDGKEYIITTQDGLITPAPWVNVIANSRLGLVVSESGSMYTWFENAHEYRLTTWSNDPVCDSPGEAYYVRDDETGEFWSPTPLPARGRTAYTSRHGVGYSIFEHAENGLRSTVSVYADPAAPVKYVAIKISNESGRRRSLSILGFWEWVLGEAREKSLQHIITEMDAQTQVIFARNRHHPDFSECVAFVGVNETIKSATGDRTEFLGRNGTLANPAALGRTKLSGRVGAGLDPCAAIHVPLELADQDQHEIVFFLGAGKNVEEARALVLRHRTTQAARESLEGVWSFWNNQLAKVQVETPDPAFNILANVWLPYQTLSCRLWGRSGFYQSGGAYGFRDQLQDAMALVHHAPQVLREHLLRCAGRQFREGDVQHWWHPPLGRGVRTKISDDLLWLPLAVCRYVKTTGDTGVLSERIAYLEGPPLKPAEESHYDQPSRTEDTATLYEHCVKAIERGLKFGAHGLPLMGAGDWNDGMNLVGQHGQGESVWLAFFIYEVLNEFSPLADQQGHQPFAQYCRAAAAQLRENIEVHAWDGHWYRRAYFDNGEPLGSATNAECQIDSLPQSWAVISGGGDLRRQVESMAAVNKRLVHRNARLIQLFDPPFDQSPLNPGYIKGYLPGVRENGGQYTHAAIWTTMAFALLGDRRRAWELFGLINPIAHGGTPEDIATYKVEPYVVAADVYAISPHAGRGGWTWYTGSAGWMYRLMLETLLGLVRVGSTLHFHPCLPEAWTSFKLRYHYHSTCYHLQIRRTSGAEMEIVLDGVALPGQEVNLVDDQKDHGVEIALPAELAPRQPPAEPQAKVPSVAQPEALLAESS